MELTLVNLMHSTLNTFIQFVTSSFHLDKEANERVSSLFGTSARERPIGATGIVTVSFFDKINNDKINNAVVVDIFKKEML